MEMQLRKIFGQSIPGILNFASIINDSQDFPPKTTVTSGNVTESWNMTELDIYATLQHYKNYRMAVSVGIYIIPILIVLGTVGNFLSVLVMTRKTMIKSSTCYYMAALAVADMIVLYGVCFRNWLSYVTGYDLITSSKAACKIISFVCYSSIAMAAWILVAMTIDRYVVIHYPLKVIKYATVSRAKKVMILLTVLLTGFNLHYLFTVSLNDAGTCTAVKAGKKNFLDLIWPWLDATICCFLPFIILVIFNSLIIHDHHRAVIRRTSLQPSVSPGHRYTTSGLPFYKKHSNRRITVMLLLVSISFLLTASPKAILVIIRPYIFNVLEEGLGINFELLAIYSLTSSITDILMYTNHSLNFFLYCFSGQKFREELKNLFWKCVDSNRSRRASTVSAINNMRRNSALCGLNINNDENTITTEIESTYL